eukprot:129260-Pleurochrysis_carterae.AAC.1
MGVNISNVTWVIHFGVPSTLEVGDCRSDQCLTCSSVYKLCASCASCTTSSSGGAGATAGRSKRPCSAAQATLSGARSVDLSRGEQGRRKAKELGCATGPTHGGEGDKV